MEEIKLQPGIKWRSPGDGGYYQIVALAKERTSGKEIIVYQQLFQPFTVFAETAEDFFGRIREEKAQMSSAKDGETICETKKETHTGCETKCETFQGRETSRETGEPEIHPQFRRFLDAKGNEERIEVLKGMRDIVDNTMINSMAVLLDTEIKDGPIGERFDELLEFMQMKGRYEIERY